MAVNEPDSWDVFVESGTRPDGVGVGTHRHPAAELAWHSGRGVQRVCTREGVWILPSKFALWIPGDEPHDGWKLGPGRSYWTKVARERTAELPRRCIAVRMPPALRRAVMQTSDQGRLVFADPRAAALREALAEHLCDAGLAPVPFPQDIPAAVQPICSILMQEPNDDRTIEEWAAILGGSSRTLARIFQSGLGLSFSELRTRIRLLWGLERLALGERVASVAEQLGYRHASSFAEAFREQLGRTPSRYFDAA